MHTLSNFLGYGTIPRGAKDSARNLRQGSSEDRNTPNLIRTSLVTVWPALCRLAHRAATPQTSTDETAKTNAHDSFAHCGHSMRPTAFFGDLYYVAVVLCCDSRSSIAAAIRGIPKDDDCEEDIEDGRNIARLTSSGSIRLADESKHGWDLSAANVSSGSCECSRLYHLHACRTKLRNQLVLRFRSTLKKAEDAIRQVCNVENISLSLERCGAFDLLRKISFAPHSAELAPSAVPVLEAIAGPLKMLAGWAKTKGRQQKIYFAFRCLRTSAVVTKCFAPLCTSVDSQSSARAQS